MGKTSNITFSDVEKYKRQRELANARNRKYNENMSAEKLYQKRQRDRERYQRLKSENKIKLVAEMTEKEKLERRKVWKKKKAKLRKKLKEENVLTNTPSNTDIIEDDVDYHQTNKMDHDECITEEESETNASWSVNVEPEVEIQESEPIIDVVQIIKQDIKEEEHMSGSEEENSFQAVQEYESVLVDKICEVCGNPFQTFELVNHAAKKNPQLTICHMCSYYITPHSIKIEPKEEEKEDEKSANKKFMCGKCPKSFARKDRLDRHQVTHSESRPFSCKTCKKSFKRNDKLAEHIKMVHGVTSSVENSAELMCNVCGDIDGVITVSVGDKTEMFVNLCEVCNLSRQERLSKSMRKELKLFQCDLCSRHFSRKDHASRHRLTHLDVKPFECYICMKSFNRNDRLLRHMKTHPDAKPFSCKICSESFADRNELRSHQASHPIVRHKKHKCEICEKAFRDKDKLKRHLTCHKNYKPHCCEFCGKTFKLQETLLSHQQVHSNWKPFQCESCGMAFKLKDTYQRHLLVHKNVIRSYSCNICSKTFQRRDKLKLHNLVHIDIKPWTCDLCDSAFKRKDKYQRHCREVHSSGADGGLRIICEICGSNFNCEDDLTEHKMVHYR